MIGEGGPAPWAELRALSFSPGVLLPPTLSGTSDGHTAWSPRKCKVPHIASGVAQGPLLPTSYSPGYYQTLHTWDSGCTQLLPFLQGENFWEGNSLILQVGKLRPRNKVIKQAGSGMDMAPICLTQAPPSLPPTVSISQTTAGNTTPASMEGPV